MRICAPKLGGLSCVPGESRWAKARWSSAPEGGDWLGSRSLSALGWEAQRPPFRPVSGRPAGPAGRSGQDSAPRPVRGGGGAGAGRAPGSDVSLRDWSRRPIYSLGPGRRPRSEWSGARASSEPAGGERTAQSVGERAAERGGRGAGPEWPAAGQRGAVGAPGAGLAGGGAADVERRAGGGGAGGAFGPATPLHSPAAWSAGPGLPLLPGRAWRGRGGGYVSPLRMGHGAGMERVRNFPESGVLRPVPSQRQQRPPPQTGVRHPQQGSPSLCTTPLPSAKKVRPTWDQVGDVGVRVVSPNPQEERPSPGGVGGGGSQRSAPQGSWGPGRGLAIQPHLHLPPLLRGCGQDWAFALPGPVGNLEVPRSPRRKIHDGKIPNLDGRQGGRERSCPFKPVPARGLAWPVGGPC